ncbi:unnamed protein product (macronuclear) [Paramecium tetraurelia]|uniref:Cyclic nucleotide-binding domain-containing protein n=1 Tax=Paramecium tetraurelia TaxID=5888 RepID=A0CDV1_PARTE|nr:uncharacterized protein GSPATT00007180001 [Paramecium tetraurelia]CAK68968.1 unnamed protein product [Paramecium tetraurelia]|eukprot:XP_001436365.1 hypothetical protein (macronuclear) [Paramecium tetraurelia strain d4-2]
MKQQVSFLAKNTFSRNINSDEVNEIQDRSGYDIFNMDGQNRKKEKLSPIIQSNSGHHESLILQYANPQQLITPKNENFTQRLQPIAQTDLNKQTKSFRKLIVYFHQKDFIKRLLAPQKLTSSFTLKHFNLINDLGASFKYQVGRYNENQKSLIHQYISLIDIRIQLRLKFRTIKTQCKHYFQYIHNQIPLIEPMSNLKFFWDLICFGIRIYLIVIIPILMAFHHQNFIDQQYVPLIFVSIALIFDIIIRAFTVTYDQGLPVRDRYLLYKKQLNFSTLLELFSFIYTIIISLQSDNIIEKKIIGDGWPKFILVLQYIQVANILKFIDISQYSFKLSRMSTSIVELIKLITLILLVQHIFSCVWIVFGIQGQNTQQQSWLDKFEYDQWSYQFLQSFYFICVTTFTVGYGDLTPKNPPEQIFTIIYMFLCMLLFSYTVNTIGSILTQIKESSDKIKTKLTAINQYMHNKQISPTLQFKVREQLYFYLKQEVVQQVNEQSEIISMLPEELQHSLRTEAAKSLIYKCSFFNENFSNEILNQLMEDVNFQIFQPGATIQSKDEFFIHIIEQGQVEVLYKKKSIQTLEKFDYFGLEEFVTQQYNSNFVFKSNAFTSVLSIPYSHFHKILSQNDLENQKFQNLLTSQPSIQNYCFICKTKRHTTQFCSQVHFIPNREVVLKRYLYRKKQKKRVKQDRRIRQLQLNEVNIINGENQSKQIQFKNACQNQKNVEFIVNKFQVENQIALETLFPTIEQPVSVDSQSESENEDPDEVKDNSFSQQQQNSRRGSKQIPPISSNDLCQYQILDKLKKEKQNRFVPHQQAQLQMSQYGQINANTNININMKQQLRKLLLCKPGLFEYQEQKAQIQELNFFNDLKQKMNNLHLFPKTEQTQIEFWYKKIVNLKEDLVDMQDFETLKNYEVFNRQWNADLVVKKLGIKLKKFRGFKKLKRYLLFPYLYVNKYLDKKDSNDQNKPVEKSKKKRPTRPKVIKKTRVSPKI